MHMDKYAVFGNPINHSRSPEIHTQFAKQTKQKISYEKILAPLDNFAGSLYEFQKAGGKGANITLPFKEQAYQLCHQLSERAKLAKAVNTIKFLEDGTLYGDNTDGVGLVNDLHQYIKLKGLNILLLGAGGASRGVIQPLLKQKPDCLIIANRTAEKAKQLADEYVAIAGNIEGIGLDELSQRDEQFDLIINGTSTSLSGELPDLPLHLLKGSGLTYDMAYGKDKTVFQLWGENQGATISLEGSGMLIEQAAESFYLWRNVHPVTEPIKVQLRLE